jgi:uncharacterized protein (UPF0332 family)
MTSGIFETEYGRIFDYIRKKREETDYSARIVVNEDTAKRIVGDAEKFITRISEYLRSI